MGARTADLSPISAARVTSLYVYPQWITRRVPGSAAVQHGDLYIAIQSNTPQHSDTCSDHVRVVATDHPSDCLPVSAVSGRQDNHRNSPQARKSQRHRGEYWLPPCCSFGTLRLAVSPYGGRDNEKCRYFG